MSRRTENSLEAAANKTLGVEDSVLRVHGGLIFGGITNQTLLRRESDVGRSRAVTLCAQDMYKIGSKKVRFTHDRWQ